MRQARSGEVMINQGNGNNTQPPTTHTQVCSGIKCTTLDGARLCRRGGSKLRSRCGSLCFPHISDVFTLLGSVRRRFWVNAFTDPYSLPPSVLVSVPLSVLRTVCTVCTFVLRVHLYCLYILVLSWIVGVKPCGVGCTCSDGVGGGRVI